MPGTLKDRFGILRPLQVRDFRFLWIGTTVSMVGDGIFIVTLAWQVYSLSHSPAALAVVGAAQATPIVLLLLGAGVLADRVDRRYLMIVGDLLRFAAVGAMSLMVTSHTVTVPRIVALAVVVGIGQALYMPAFSSIVPFVVSEDLLVEASSLAEFVRPIAQTLAGPFIGGVIVGVAGTGWAFAADAASFAWSASMIALMRPHREEPAEVSKPLEDLREGFRWVRANRWFWISLVSTGIGVLLTAGAWEVLVPYIVKEELHASAVVLGLVYALGGCAAVVTAAVMGQRGRLPKRPITTYYGLWAMSCLAQVGFGIAFHVWQVAITAMVIQTCVTAFSVLWFTMEYRIVPAALLGRVSSIDWLLVLAGAPLAFALVGPLVHLFGARGTMVVTGSLGTIAMLIPLILRGALDPEHDGSLAEPVVEPALVSET
jgi:DHA3 family tetracycline resistance protein-like MFS transporter